jgi:outer membrane protein TolC
MLSLSIPIFRGKYKAAKKEAQLMQEAYKLQKEDLTNNLISSYDLTWFEIQKQLEFITLYQEQIQTSKQSLRLLFRAYSDSGKEFEEVLRMQQQILKYQKMKVKALAQYHTALAQLDYLTAKTQ